MRRAARKDANHAKPSAAKIAACRRNLVRAMDANRARPSSRIPKPCRRCSRTMLVRPSEWEKKFYCSAACMSEDYKTRLRGAANPNHRGTPRHTCPTCGLEFTSYSKTARYCSRACQGRSPGALARAKIASAVAAAAAPARRRVRRCAECEAVVPHNRRKYCEVCLPRWRARNGGHKVDANHAEIVAGLRACGVSVLDTSAVGSGCPDIIAGVNGRTYLVEIKNPATKYGRKGLNANQSEWAAAWRGGPVAVVTTLSEALAAVGVRASVAE